MHEIYQEILRDGGMTPSKKIKQTAQRFPEKIAMRYKEFGVWQETTYQEFWKKSNYLSMGLKFFGIEKGHSVAIRSLQETSRSLTKGIKSYLQNKNFSKNKINRINAQLIALEKSFISEKGMYFGTWYKSLYASSDPFSGYAAWILPGIEYEIALKASDRLEEWDLRYANAINSLDNKMKELNKQIQMD